MKYGGRFLICVAFVVALAPAALADSIIAMEVEGYRGYGRSAGSANGFAFTPTTDLVVTHGGFWDWNADGLPDDVTYSRDNVSWAIRDVEAGTWVASEQLYYSTSALDGPTTGGPGQFRYAELASEVHLEAGRRYLVNAMGGTGWVLVFPESFGAAPHLTIEQVSGNYGYANGFRYQPYPGANFKYEAVPEPTTLVLLGLGLAGLAFRSRRRR